MHAHTPQIRVQDDSDRCIMDAELVNEFETYPFDTDQVFQLSQRRPYPMYIH